MVFTQLQFHGLKKKKERKEKKPLMFMSLYVWHHKGRCLCHFRFAYLRHKENVLELKIDRFGLFWDGENIVGCH